MITADMVEVTEFPHMAVKYQLMGVPMTVINETVTIEGAVPEQMLALKIEENFARSGISASGEGNQ